MSPTHLAFSDDSSHVDGGFNSLSLVTIKKVFVKDFNKELEIILRDSSISSEFKWSALNDAKYRFAAKKLIEFVFRNKNKIRIDTVIWDMSDSRHHGIIGRDDSENLVRMYYHLISYTLSKKWPIRNSIWFWFPDIQAEVD